MNNDIQIHGDHPFAQRLRESMQVQAVKEELWWSQLIVDGIQAAHPNDGWVDRERNWIKFVNPYFMRPLKIGDKIAIGNPDDYRIVRIIDHEVSHFLSTEKWKFEELEPVTFSAEIKLIPIAEATKPKAGLFRIICDAWWVVSPNRELLFYRGTWSPQCNQNKRVMESMQPKHYPGCTIEQIPVVFVPINPSDYR